MTIMNVTNACAVGPNGEHLWAVAKRRGSKVRYRCNHCAKWDRWDKADDSPSAQAVNWADKTVAELRTVAKTRGFTGYSKMTKAELLNLLGGTT